MYAVGQAIVTIPGSVQRLQKQGYCQNVLMQDVWKLTVTQNAQGIQDARNQDSSNSVIPIIFITLITDEVNPQ